MPPKERHPPPKSFAGDGRFKPHGRPSGASLNGRAPTEAIKDLPAQLRALGVQARALVAAWVGLARAKMRVFAVLAGAGIIGFVIVVAAAVTGSVLLVRGMAGGLALLFGGRPWLGDLVAGLVVLGGLAAGTWLVSKVMKKAREKSPGDGRVERAKARERARMPAGDEHHG
jgi:hypothetical protein